MTEHFVLIAVLSEKAHVAHIQLCGIFSVINHFLFRTKNGVMNMKCVTSWA